MSVGRPVVVFSDAERRRRLAVRHRLIPSERTDDLVRIADDLIGLHSSDPATVYLSAIVRMVHPSVEAVEHALYDQRSLIRHHAMRRTIWVMTPAVARLAHMAATMPIAAAERRKNLKALAASPEVDDPDAWLDAATADVVALLESEGPMNTRSIGRALPHLVIPLIYGTPKYGATLNAHTKVLQGAGFDGVVIRGRPGGTWISSEYPWSTASAWLDRPLDDGDHAGSAAELVGRWLLRFGPATEVDLTWWFGWTKTLVRRALADAAAVAVRLEGGDIGWIAPGDDAETTAPEPWVRLLPGLDSTAMGWKERDWYLHPSHVGRLFDRNGNAGPTIWADGRVVGGWIQRADGSVALDLCESLGDEHRMLLDQAIDELRAAVGDVVVRPRFPSRNQKDLLAS